MPCIPYNNNLYLDLSQVGSITVRPQRTDYQNASRYCQNKRMLLSNDGVLEDMIKTKQIIPEASSYYWVPVTRYLQLYWRSLGGIDSQREFIL